MYIFKILQEKILNLLHKEHVGMIRMKILARKEIWFSGIDKDIEKTVNNCVTCQIFERNSAKNNLVSKWPECHKPFERIHLDFYTKHGWDFLICVDAYSRYSSGRN